MIALFEPSWMTSRLRGVMLFAYTPLMIVVVCTQRHQASCEAVAEIFTPLICWGVFSEPSLFTSAYHRLPLTAKISCCTSEPEGRKSTSIWGWTSGEPAAIHQS